MPMLKMMGLLFIRTYSTNTMRQSSTQMSIFL